ncbi:hypothetical protein E2562_013766 [Oryza meyeriana var. granulata]|uniref:Uncharacterized protein n=1 Tax=Oryza meyeriana var. granulata TaxID=110450 RepID=A0A6G1F7V7_9ORYZ|nr:hypothetical protein E2562_013766 [Oryza meyeriana var. granulata]
MGEEVPPHPPTVVERTTTCGSLAFLELMVARSNGPWQVRGRGREVGDRWLPTRGDIEEGIESGGMQGGEVEGQRGLAEGFHCLLVDLHDMTCQAVSGVLAAGLLGLTTNVHM